MNATLVLVALAALSAPLAAAGCSNGGDPDGSTVVVNGSVGGAGFAARSAIAVSSLSTLEVAADGGSGTVATRYFQIVLVDKDETCTALHNASTNGLSLTLLPAGQVGGNTSFAVIDPDQASTATTGQAEVSLFATTATCADEAMPPSAIGGSVVLDTVTPTEVSGTFDVTFAAGHLSGSFTAPICASSILDVLADGGTPACTP